MTILASALRLPRLRAKDANCTLSWFEGSETYSAIPSVGNYPNLGSLGDQTALKLTSESAFLRPNARGIAPGAVPHLYPTNQSHGLSTEETSLGESSAITMECWVRTSSGVPQQIMGKLYNTGTSPWTGAIITTLLALGTGGALASYGALSGSTYFGPIGSSTCVVSLNAWSHVGLTWTSGGPVRNYLNGVKMAESSNVPILWGNHGRWIVGGRGGRGSSSDLNSEGFYGSIQGARVHDVERSETWMQETYQRGRGLL